MSALTLKKQELARRVATLPKELADWRHAATNELEYNAHFSQLEAIGVLMETMTGPQTTAVAALDPEGDAAAFKQAALKIVQDVSKAQRTWDFFRDKLELRYSPAHKEPLWVADTIAWNCHRTALDKAVEWQAVDRNRVREPPLVYCSWDYSPATWVRQSRPYDGRDYELGQVLLPIPVIEMPWDHLDNSWEYLSLHHEVGHDIEADLALRVPLQATLQTALDAAGTFAPRRAVWRNWQSEVFADLCALRLAGPAFADALLQLLLLPAAAVTTYVGSDPHPTPYVRMLLNAAYIRTLDASPAIQQHATDIETAWRTLYGATSGSPPLDAYADDFGTVFTALMKTPLAALKNHTVEELLPFSAAEDARIRSSVPYFRQGTNKPNNLTIRHVPSAARLAVAADAVAGTLTQDQCAAIHGRVLTYIRQNAPSSLRGGGNKQHEQFIASFADRMFT